MLILSIFPGIDLLGRAFELEGFCVVRGPDLIFGQDIKDFHPVAGRFDGVIGGSPCQGFSKKNRNPNRAYSEWALAQFARVVTEAVPEFFLLENVPTVPNITIEGYKVQRFDIWAHEVGLKQRRLRHFQYGSKSGQPLIVDRDSSNVNRPGIITPANSHFVNDQAIKLPGRSQLEPCCLASEGKQKDRRAFAEFCELQGLPRDFDLPGWSIAFKYAAVGNGVPIPMGRCVARAIVNNRQNSMPGSSQIRLCACDCGRRVSGRRITASDACRKRLQKKRERAESVSRCGVTSPRTVTDLQVKE